MARPSRPEPYWTAVGICELRSRRAFGDFRVDSDMFHGQWAWQDMEWWRAHGIEERKREDYQACLAQSWHSAVVVAGVGRGRVRSSARDRVSDYRPFFPSPIVYQISRNTHRPHVITRVHKNITYVLGLL